MHAPRQMHNTNDLEHAHFHSALEVEARANSSKASDEISFPITWGMVGQSQTTLTVSEIRLVGFQLGWFSTGLGESMGP
jgi:hypothetical protein